MAQISIPDRSDAEKLLDSWPGKKAGPKFCFFSSSVFQADAEKQKTID